MVDFFLTDFNDVKLLVLVGDFEVLLMNLVLLHAEAEIQLLSVSHHVSSHVVDLKVVLI